MTSSDNMVPVFDGHNDFLFRLHTSEQDKVVEGFCEGGEKGHIDLPKAKKGGLAGGLCAVYVPSPNKEVDSDGNFLAPDQPTALDTSLAMASMLFRIEAHSKGGLTVCRSAADIRSAMDKGSFASVLHIEGVEAFDHDLDELYVLHQAGLRSLGPVWSRPNIFAYGVPFRFNSTPDIGPALTESGKRLIKVCNELKVMIDLSHMNEKGFWDVAEISDAPLVASHSNAHALCPHSRNLTDKQLDAIRDTGGLVGINYGISFLREDGQRITDTPVSELIRHIDYIANRIGIDHVALGSDYDGTTIPDALASAADQQLVIAEMRKHGFDEASINKVAHENWINVLEKTWGA